MVVETIDGKHVTFPRSKVTFEKIEGCVSKVLRRFIERQEWSHSALTTSGKSLKEPFQKNLHKHCFELECLSISCAWRLGYWSGSLSD